MVRGSHGGRYGTARLIVVNSIYGNFVTALSAASGIVGAIELHVPDRSSGSGRSEQRIKRQQQLGDDQDDDVPFNPQAAARLRQPEQRFDRTRDDIELTVDRPTALTQFVDVGET